MLLHQPQRLAGLELARPVRDDGEKIPASLLTGQAATPGLVRILDAGKMAEQDAVRVQRPFRLSRRA